MRDDPAGRTVLAWRRTAVGAAGGAALAVHVALRDRPLLLTTTLALVALGAWCARPVPIGGPRPCRRSVRLASALALLAAAATIGALLAGA